MLDRHPPLVLGEFVTTPLGQRAYFWRLMGKVRMPRLVTCPADVKRLYCDGLISLQQFDEELRRWH